jgi:hypothetical protein
VGHLVSLIVAVTAFNIGQFAVGLIYVHPGALTT